MASTSTRAVGVVSALLALLVAGMGPARAERPGAWSTSRYVELTAERQPVAPIEDLLPPGARDKDWYRHGQPHWYSGGQHVQAICPTEGARKRMHRRAEDSRCALVLVSGGQVLDRVRVPDLPREGRVLVRSEPCGADRILWFPTLSPDGRQDGAVVVSFSPQGTGVSSTLDASTVPGLLGVQDVRLGPHGTVYAIVSVTSQDAETPHRLLVLGADPATWTVRARGRQMHLVFLEDSLVPDRVHTLLRTSKGWYTLDEAGAPQPRKERALGGVDRVTELVDSPLQPWPRRAVDAKTYTQGSSSVIELSILTVEGGVPVVRAQQYVVTDDKGEPLSCTGPLEHDWPGPYFGRPPRERRWVGGVTLECRVEGRAPTMVWLPARPGARSVEIPSTGWGARRSREVSPATIWEARWTAEDNRVTGCQVSVTDKATGLRYHLEDLACPSGRLEEHLLPRWSFRPRAGRPAPTSAPEL